jgi:hypothetical protein
MTATTDYADRVEREAKKDGERVKETRDRVRHIEIQLTRFLENGGFDTGAEKPSWNEGVVTIPSLDCSLRGILAVIPGGEEAEVFHKGTRTCFIELR